VVDWIDVTSGRDKWRAVVKAAMNLRVPKMREIFSLAEELLAFQELCLANAEYSCACKSSYSSPTIVRVMKSRRIRWAGHVARMGEGRGVYRVLVGET
jgi:hypothetical protein